VNAQPDVWKLVQGVITQTRSSNDHLFLPIAEMKSIGDGGDMEPGTAFNWAMAVAMLGFAICVGLACGEEKSSTETMGLFVSGF